MEVINFIFVRRWKYITKAKFRLEWVTNILVGKLLTKKEYMDINCG